MPVPADNRVIPAVQYLDNGVDSGVNVVDTGASVIHHPTPVPAVNPMMVDPSGVAGPASALAHYSVMDLVQIFVVYAFIIAAGLSALFIFIGGVNFILSGGDDEKIKKAVNTIRYSIVGLIVTILSFTFVTIVGRIFGLDFMSYLSYDKIRTSITTLINSSKSNHRSGSYFRLPRK